MMLGSRLRPACWLLAGLLSIAAPAVGLAEDAKTTADDKCVSQCDEESDKCMQQAGKDASKQRACDSSYEECLRKCG